MRVQHCVRALAIGLAVLLLASPAAARSSASTPEQSSTSAPDSRPAQPSSPKQQVDTDELPVSVDRIQQQLEHPPAINLELTRPVFRAEIVARRPLWVGSIDWLGDQAKLPQPTSPAWHDEFLSMVTPPQARLYGQANNGELLQLVATSFVQAAMTRALVGKIREAASARRAAEARREVDEALSDWQRTQDAARHPRQP
jgi:hypothetical protein